MTLNAEVSFDAFSKELGRLRVCVNSSFFGYFDGLKTSTFESCERIYIIDISLSLEIRSLGILP